MKNVYDVIMEVSVGVIAIIFLGVIVTMELLSEGAVMMVPANATIYVALIMFYIRNSLRGVKKGGNKKES